MSNEAIAALVALLGAISVKVIEGLFSQRSTLIATDSQRIDALWRRVDALQVEVDAWKAKYFDLQAKYNALEEQYQDVCGQLEQLRKGGQAS